MHERPTASDSLPSKLGLQRARDYRDLWKRYYLEEDATKEPMSRQHTSLRIESTYETLRRLERLAMKRLIWGVGIIFAVTVWRLNWTIATGE